MNCLHHTHNQKAESNKDTLLLVSFCLLLDRSQIQHLYSDWVLLLPLSGNQEIYQRHAQMPGSQVLLGPVRMTALTILLVYLF